jgi:hypothetical protein
MSAVSAETDLYPACRKMAKTWFKPVFNPEKVP